MSRPWFPFYVGDYLRDTARLTTEAHGAYLLFMLDYWSNGAPPADDETLSSIARLPLDRWMKLRQKIAPFFEISDGKWNHKRIEKELETAEEKHRKRVDAGKAGGEAKAKSQQFSSNATAEDTALPYQSQPQPPIKKEKLSSDDFENLKRIYPKRKGNYGWKKAEQKFNSLVKTGVDAKVIVAAAGRLCETLRDRIGTEFIPMPASWLNSEDFLECAVVAFDAAAEPVNWDAICISYNKTRVWSKHAPGNSPDSGSCLCPPEILIRHGIRPVMSDAVEMPPIPKLRAVQ